MRGFAPGFEMQPFLFDTHAEPHPPRTRAQCAAFVPCAQSEYGSLTAIIAISWTPHYGHNHLDSIIHDIVARMMRMRRPVQRATTRLYLGTEWRKTAGNRNTKSKTDGLSI